MALNVRTVMGSDVRQMVSQSSFGVSEMQRGTVNMRMLGYSYASAMSCSTPSMGWYMYPPTGISMLDCPLAIHTSPRRMFVSSVFSPSLKVIV